MSFPNSAIDSLLDNLTQIIQYNYDLVAGVRENFEALREELTTLKGLMNTAAKYYEDSDYLDELKRQIKTIISQAEDAVDTYVVQAQMQKTRSWISKSFHQGLRGVTMIKDIVDELRKFNREKIKTDFEVLQYQAIQILNRPERIKEAPRVEEEHVVGFEKAAEDIIRLVTRGPEQLEVISIVGMIGLGKTTLAKKVYKYPDVDYEYMIRAFVYVSREYEKREVYLKILSSFTQRSDEVNKMTEEQVEKHLYKQLEGKQYLVVLDDVSEKEDWNKLKDAFPNNKKRCRVLITTRNKMVAERASQNISPYYLEFLTLEKSQELLRWRVFHENYCPRALQEYEIQIAAKCDGLPLAIVHIAGIILNHPDRVDWWMEVANTVKHYIARDQAQTTKVIELMYRHLPDHLKTCFLYLGVFREDFEIPVWKLVRLWISEGLIQEGNLNLEDMAELYLEELVHRNLVIVVQRRRNDRIKTCRMHDTLSEFCKKKAAEENLFQEINKDKLSFFLSGNPTLDQYRRLYINNVNILEYISGEPSGKCVRSFLTFVKEAIQLEPKLVSCIPKTFKLLRVLEIQSLIFTRFPVDLCNLALLKYIAISSNFSYLPSSLSTLFNLQTLIVNTTSRTLEIKADIWNMPQFRHLHTNASTSLPSPRFNKKSKEEALIGKNVQTLSTISPESCKKEVFDQTPNLKKLSIHGALAKLFEVSGESTSSGYLQSLKFLENLKLLNGEEYLRLGRLPSEKSFPTLLKQLTVSNTQLEWKEIATLGKLENLEVLKLKNNAFMGKLWQTEKGAFLSLKHLHIGRTDLEIWIASADDFPLLKRLKLTNCDRLQGIPDDFANIPSLQLVVLLYTNPQVATSAKRLQVFKQEQARHGNKNSSFKLSVYPPEH